VIRAIPWLRAGRPATTLRALLRTAPTACLHAMADPGAGREEDRLS
jgi:hypothetical protein